MKNSRDKWDVLPGVTDPDERALQAALIWRTRMPRKHTEDWSEARARFDDTEAFPRIGLKLRDGFSLMPRGYSDIGGVWHPHPIEVAPCCYDIKALDGTWKGFAPERAKYVKYAHLIHCKGLPHIACRFGVSQERVKRAWKRLKTAHALST